MFRKKIGLAVCVVALGGLFTASGAEKKADADQAKLQGTWKAVEGGFPGGTTQLVFEGNKFTLRKDDKENVTGTFKTDSTKKPREINMTVGGGTAKEAEHYKDKTSHGIYAVDGDTLKWCANEPGKEERPKEFAGKAEGARFLYVVFKREKK